jgi:hypothetical protein
VAAQEAAAVVGVAERSLSATATPRWAATARLASVQAQAAELVVPLPLARVVVPVPAPEEVAVRRASP